MANRERRYDLDQLCMREVGRPFDEKIDFILTFGRRIQLSEEQYQRVTGCIALAFFISSILTLCSTTLMWPYPVTMWRVMACCFIGFCFMYASLYFIQRCFGIDICYCWLYCLTDYPMEDSLNSNSTLPNINWTPPNEEEQPDFEDNRRYISEAASAGQSVEGPTSTTVLAPTSLGPMHSVDEPTSTTVLAPANLGPMHSTDNGAVC
ncbi:hypothetical protein CDAR_19111 [Caerostris darwini]|uniref:Uncharacterized protein n=1 Tax=Caerostris darwini TaxID=1538125 RepID=A0AAV4WFY1_9ARAC|nr:hypothetical protein CDAR_19111 [Caerostris darwini]